tara:strand:- start:673 stop:816 length:144 start_codon:yes stop_codon:yes gene_type:complete
MKKIDDIKAWMKWKGIEPKDVVMMSFAMGFLISVIGVFLWAGIQSLL